jgi:hypothetical protein
MSYQSLPRPDLGPIHPLYNGYRVTFSEVKRLGRGVDHPPPSSAEVKEIVALHLYFPLAFMACSRMNFTSTYRVLYWNGSKRFGSTEVWKTWVILKEEREDRMFHLNNWFSVVSKQFSVGFLQNQEPAKINIVTTIENLHTFFAWGL